MTQAPTAVVFGGTGFVGHAVVQALAAKGWQVRVPTRDPEKAMELKVLGAVGQIVPLAISCRSDTSLTAAMKGADLVVNLIGEITQSKKDSFRAIHVELAARLTRIAHSVGVARFVHLSALGARADSPSAYLRSKALGEEAVRAFFPCAVVLRPSLIFGPRDTLLNRMSIMARFLPFVPLIGGGHTRFQPVYVGDVAAAVVAVAQGGHHCGQIYRLGGSRTYSFREMMVLMLRLTHRKRWLATVPWGLAVWKARFFEMLPRPPLTRDQIMMLRQDHVLAADVGPGFAYLGIKPASLEEIWPSYVF